MWAFSSPIFGTELSTIFLNIQWFGKHFKKKRLEKICKILFVITWFSVRVPIVFYSSIWIIVNFKAMKDNPEFPFHAFVYIVIILFTMLPLQMIWTVIIATKTVKTCLPK